MRFPAVWALYGILACAACEPTIKAPPAAGPSVTAEFDPTASPPVVPTPNDLAFAGGDGTHLNVVDQPNDSPAQRAFNAYLNTLQGFPPSSTASASFSGALVPSTVTVQTATMPGSLVVVDTTTGMLVTGLTATLGSDGKTITITNPARWASGHKFAVVVFGGHDPHGLQGQGGATVLASPAFFFLRSPRPLVALCLDPSNPRCACPSPSDTRCHTAVTGLSDAQARQAEPLRQQVAAALGQILPLAAPGRSRNDVVLFWTFTITPQPVAEFDPTSGTIPFPNDVLINPMTGLVNLPITPTDPLAPIEMQLNTLDGFSVSAAITLPVDVAPKVTVDPGSVVPGQSAILVNLDMTPGAEQPLYDAVPTFTSAQVTLLPRLPLVSDQRRYAVVVTRQVTALGNNLVPSPTTALILQPNPLFDGTHSTVNVLSDMQAAQLETLRVSLAPLVAALQARGLFPAAIAALWTFTTQSIVRPLAALDALPTQAGLPTDVTATAYTNFAMLPAALAPYVADVRAVVLGSFTTQLVYDPKTRAVTFMRMPSPAAPSQPAADIFTVMPAGPTATVRFWLTLPKGRPNDAPVVIAQHGLTSWRGDVFTLGEDFAKADMATIGFDIDFHGARTRCSADNQCNGGAAGSCNLTTGECAGGFVPKTSNALACDLAAFSGDTATDCEPAASGTGYIDPSNLVSARSGGFQYVADAAQLVRVLQATGGNSLQARLAGASLAGAIDPTKLSFLGMSLGAVNGTLFLAVDPRPAGGNVLNVGGGHVFEIIASGEFHPLVDPLLMALNIQRGTPAFNQLVQTARWVLDPVDPFSVARYIRRAPAFSYLTGTMNPPKLAIVQEAGMDTVILPPFEADLSLSLWGPNGVDAAGHAQGADASGDFVSTYFPDANHGTLLTAMPSPSMRLQADTYVISGGTNLPAATP